MKYKIEKGILSQNRGGRKPVYDYKGLPLDRMKSGDSIQVLVFKDRKKANSAQVSMYNWFKRNNKPGFTLGCRILDNNQVEVRLWKD